jgi:hypothetical protein
MEKLYYNEQGFVCKRYPLDFPVEDENRYIEVSDEEFRKTFSSLTNFAWKINNGQLVNERYQNDDELEILTAELEQIQNWFRQNDWIPNKILTGEWLNNDPR